LAFPVVVWLFAAFFLLGDLGKWADDYAVTLRSPVTGAVQTWIYDIHGTFFRPLWVWTFAGLQTLLWSHDNLNHLISVLLHGLCAITLAALLRALGRGRMAIGTAVVFFLAFPVHFQAILWLAAIGALLGTLPILVLLLLYARFAAGRAGWWALAPMGALAFLGPCFNEQPAGTLIAMPLIYLAVRPPGEPFRRSLARIVLPTALCAIACAAYISLYLATSPAASFGQAGTLIPLRKFPSATARFFLDVFDWLMLRNFKNTAQRLGLSALQEHPARAALWLLLLAGAYTAWLRSFRNTHAPAFGAEPVPQPPSLHRTSLVALAGPVMFFGAWLPVVVIAQYRTPDSRLFYAPMVGLSVLIAVLVDATAHRLLRRARPMPAPIRLGAPIAFFGMLLWFSLLMIGAQAAFQQRSRLDMQQSETLKRLVPDPAPGTFFLPAWVLDKDRFAKDKHLGTIHHHPVWSSPWTVKHHVRFIYRRMDLWAGYANPAFDGWGLLGADERGLRYRWPQPDASGYQPDPQGGTFIPWDKVIPFIIDESGRLRLITTVVIPDPSGGPATRIEIPQLRAAVTAGDVPPLDFGIPPTGP
jgi:hypothetical protein